MASDLLQDPTSQHPDFLAEDAVTESDHMMVMLLDTYNEDVGDHLRPEACTVTDQAHVSRPPPWTYPTERQHRNVDGIHGLALPDEAMAMTASIRYSDGRLASVDLSQDHQRSDLLHSLEKTGWFLVEAATSVNSTTKQCDLEENAIVKKILGIEGKEYSLGRYRSRQVNVHAREQFFRSKDGSQYKIPLQAIFVIHLGNSTSDTWVFEYIPVDDQIPCERLVKGCDILFVASWMTWRVPWRADLTYASIGEIVYIKNAR